MKLTVAIPTFNRNAVLAANLAALLPQVAEFSEHCRVRIFDNCSPVPAAETLQPLLDAFPGVSCTITRHPVNIGGNANIMRCFETCETEWLWVLGDDDAVAAGGLEVILRSVERCPDSLFFSFSTAAYPIRSTTSCRGLAGFADSIGSFSSTLFLSASVYRVGAMADRIRAGYQWAYSGAPHLAVLLCSLGGDGPAWFVAEEIVHQNSPDDPRERWSLTAHAVAMGTLLDLPLPQPVRETLARKILATFPTTEQIFTQLVLQAAQDKDPRPALFYYRQVMDRLYRFDPSPARRLKRALYRALLHVPRLGYAFAALAYWVTRRKKLDQSLLHDRFARL